MEANKEEAVKAMSVAQRTLGERNLTKGAAPALNT